MMATQDEGVAEVLHQPTTSQGRNRQRTVWSIEVNEFIVRCYYKITRLERTKTPYSKELHKAVIEHFPNLRTKTVQNIIDQRRSIFINNRLPADTINRIKREVAAELGVEQPPEEEIEVETTGIQAPASCPESECFEKNHFQFNGLDPISKPPLPKLRFSPNTRKLLKAIDLLIKTKITPETTLEELHSLIYTGSATALELSGQKISYVTPKAKTCAMPPWERRLSKKIDTLRREIGIITQNQKPNPSRKVLKMAAKIIHRERTSQNPTPIDILDLLKQKLAAAAKRLKRYKESFARKVQNQQFSTSERKFYKSLNINDTPNNATPVLPKAETVRTFWENIWSLPAQHKRSKWLSEERKTTTNLRTMLTWEITLDDVQKAVRRTLNWKTPGPDKIQNFWIKQFKSTHRQLANCFTSILERPEIIPDFMTSGITYLKPKTPQYSENPAQYRPITCLPTTYKILTSIISEKLYNHLEKNKLLDEEQKGCRKKSRGCKEQLVIDSIVMSNAKKNKTPLHTAYIDYQKAFDSVPHSWLLEVLDLYGIEAHIKGFLKSVMEKWRTKLLINSTQSTLNVGTINIRRGIFQGDALSPIWFCLALRPLTTILNAQNKGYTLKIQNPYVISHLWYMDDLKLYADSKEHLENLLGCVEKFSRDIGMKFGLDKCKISSMKKGKWVQHEGYEAGGNQGRIEGMEEGEKYKYLGYLQAQEIDQKTAKQTFTNTYLQRIRALLRSKLSAKNMAKAINTYAVSALSYSFGIIKWTNTDLEDLNIKTRNEFRKQRAHHPKSSCCRFHLPRKYGGRGIPDLKVRHHRQLENLRKYFQGKAENSTLHLAIIRAERNSTPLKLSDQTFNPICEINSIEQQLEQWRSKPLHGRYLARIEQDSVDKTASTAYLRHGNLFLETEGFISAIQDQVISTKSYKKRIIGENLENIKCRLCQTKEETLDHIIAGCTILAPKSYLDRHDRVGKIVHQKLREVHMGLAETVPYYQYDPPAVCENNEVRLYWNRKIQTDRPIINNIPDIVLTFKNIKRTYIIDFAVPLCDNINKTYAEKINKYLPLRDEILQMWRMEETKIIPIVIGATGEVPKNLKNSLLQLGLDWEIYLSLQKSILLDTCSIVRRVIGNQLNIT